MRLDDSPWLHERRWAAVQKHLETDDVILIPVGATEQHADHMPLMVDTGWAIAVAEGAALASGALAAPPLHVGWSPHHLAYPGSITLRPETLISVLVDVGESLIFHGFKRIVMVNGNRVANLPPMEIAASKLRFRTGAYVSVVDVGLIARREVYNICEQGQNGHAGDSETSFMLHWCPDLVDMTRAVSVESRSSGALSHDPIPMDPPFDLNAVHVRSTAEDLLADVAERGAGGDARMATPEKGAAILSSIIRNTADHIAEIRQRSVCRKQVAIPI